MSKADDVLDVLRNIDSSKNFQFPAANLEQLNTITANTATTTIQCNLANVFNVTLAANTEFAFDYSQITLTDDDAYTMTIVVTQDATNDYTLTFPSSCKFQSGIAPAIPSVGETDVYVCFTVDGGVNWLVFLAGEDMG